MCKPFCYSTSYILDKSHFSETFDETHCKPNASKAYAKSIILGLIGIGILYFAKLGSYAGWFIVVLALVDACSVYFKKPWWLARQMISQAANVELTLTIDETGISTKSFSVDTKIEWTSLTSIEHTQRGWLLFHPAGRSYISSRCLTPAATLYIQNMAKTINP